LREIWLLTKKYLILKLNYYHSIKQNFVTNKLCLFDKLNIIVNFETEYEHEEFIK
jgi:hypothetical protein